MDDSFDMMALHLEQKEEARAALVNSISSCEHFCGFSYPTDLPSSSSLAMDYTDTPPLFNHSNLRPSMNETPNLSVFSHFTAPVRNTHSHPPLNHNNQISSQRMVCSTASTLAMDYGTVHNTTEILHMGRQPDGTFPQHDCHQGALDIGLASMSGCFSPWVAPKHGSIMVIPGNPKKGQLLLKKCLFKMLPWMRDVNNCGRADINQGSNLGVTNPNNNEAMSINNDVMLMEQNHCNPNITMASHKHLLAERNRRRKQSECLRVLQALLPGKPKKDKLSIINCAIEHIKKLKDTNEYLEKHIKGLQSTNLTPRSVWVSRSSSGRNLMREKGRGSMSSNIHGSSSITSSGLMLPPSPDVIITSSDKPQNEQDIYTKITSMGTASVRINTTLQYDHTLCIRVFALARATMGSHKLFKVLTCLKDLGFEALSLQSTFEGDTFMVEISAIANQDSSLNEAQIKDSLINALLSTHL